jgi:hypothetical protein
MKNFIITSKVQSIKTLQYNIEAESLEEAIAKVEEGKYRWEAEEVVDEINWSDETNIKGWEDKDDDEITIPAGTKGIFISKNSSYYAAKFGANVEVEFDYTGGDIISVKWLDDLANDQRNGGYFVSDFIF